MAHLTIVFLPSSELLCCIHCLKHYYFIQAQTSSLLSLIPTHLEGVISNIISSKKLSQMTKTGLVLSCTGLNSVPQKFMSTWNL